MTRRTFPAPPPPRPASQRAFTLLELLVVLVILAALAGLVVSQVDGTRENAENVAARATMQTLSEALTGSAAGPGYLADVRHLPGFAITDLRPGHLLTAPINPPIPLFNPAAKRGWRGPYIRSARGVAKLGSSDTGHFPTSSDRRFVGDTTFAARGFFPSDPSRNYGDPTDLVVGDPWGNPFVIQVPLDSALPATTEASRREYARLVSAGPDGLLNTALTDATATARGDDLVVFLNRADVP